MTPSVRHRPRLDLMMFSAIPLFYQKYILLFNEFTQVWVQGSVFIFDHICQKILL
jgi:hypothetical protein